MKNEEKIVYGLYDGRYLSRPDRVILYEICDTEKEARRNATEYGDDTFIIKCSVNGNVLNHICIIK